MASAWVRPRREVHQLEPAYGSRRDEPLVADEECGTRLVPFMHSRSIPARSAVGGSMPSNRLSARVQAGERSQKTV